jgi:hypothetical protein
MHFLYTVHTTYANSMCYSLLEGGFSCFLTECHGSQHNSRSLNAGTIRARAGVTDRLSWRISDKSFHLVCERKGEDAGRVSAGLGSSQERSRSAGEILAPRMTWRALGRSKRRLWKHEICGPPWSCRGFKSFRRVAIR